jgi:hypothetical protein
MDDDFSIMAILPPYNTVHAQVVVGTNGTARLVPGTGSLQVRYQALLDAAGSINTTSVGKGNFWDYVLPMTGQALAPDEGLALPGYLPAASMPGPGNPLMPMSFVTASEWFAAWGVPITPYDDDLQRNPYPLMHVVANGGGVATTSTDIVLPVSDEMNCVRCHGSGKSTLARPEPDWEWDPVAARDFRLNVLRLHDEVRFETMADAYTNLLADVGFNTTGLYASAAISGRPVLCAVCHLSEAVPGSGQPGVKPLTQAMHGAHAPVHDPVTDMPLGDSDNRTACYNCHPGAETRCLRGAMGRAVAPDGTLAMQCQDCHGALASVASTNRTGWLDEPNCQACHTGDAFLNNGQLRYENAFTNGALRVAVNTRFATDPDTPGEGHSLFRFSRGHGNLYCSACHGSTHAEFPSAFFNDNVASMQRQGHVGQMSECSSCHGTTPNTSADGPHGMHSLGYVNNHKTPGKIPVNCQPCHGTAYQGTVLSRSFKNQTLDGQNFWRGRRIGCYECHNGAGGGGGQPAAPSATSRTASTSVNTPVAIPLTASTSLLRIVSQPTLGMVGLTGTTATYHPAAGFVGQETFTFCSDSGLRESNLATVTVTVTDTGPCAYTLSTNLEFFDELSHVGAVDVTTGPGCPWVAISETLWLSILDYGGNGSGSMHYRVARNTDGDMRVGYLSIAGKTVTVVQDGVPADTNTDGLPDSWQLLYFSDANSPNAAPGLDFDLDGRTNQEEYTTGTDPTAPDSVLGITAFSLAEAGQMFQLDFSTAPQRYYQIQRTADLLNPDWKGFTNAVIGTGAPLPQQGPVAPDAPQMFYRVRYVE